MCACVRGQFLLAANGRGLSLCPDVCWDITDSHNHLQSWRSAAGEGGGADAMVLAMVIPGGAQVENEEGTGAEEGGGGRRGGGR